MVLAAVAAVSCGGESEPEQATPPPTPDAPTPPPAAKAPGARKVPEVMVGHDYPADFPADVPRYQNAEVKTSRSSPNVGMSVVLVSSDPSEQVLKFYADSLAAEGWSTDIRDVENGRAVFADKGERTVVTMVKTGKDSRTRVRMFITQFAR